MHISVMKQPLLLVSSRTSFLFLALLPPLKSVPCRVVLGEAVFWSMQRKMGEVDWSFIHSQIYP